MIAHNQRLEYSIAAGEQQPVYMQRKPLLQQKLGHGQN